MPNKTRQAAEIEITRGMQIAGVIELAGFNPEFDDASDVVSQVYQAMETERRRSISDAYSQETSVGTSQTTAPPRSLAAN